VSEVIYNRKAGIRNAVLYGIFLVAAIWGLLTRNSVAGYILMGLAVVWAIGGLAANVRAIRHGFRADD